MIVAEAAAWADMLMMLAPDELQGEIYTDRDRAQHPRRRGAACSPTA